MHDIHEDTVDGKEGPWEAGVGGVVRGKVWAQSVSSRVVGDGSSKNTRRGCGVGTVSGVKEAG